MASDTMEAATSPNRLRKIGVNFLAACAGAALGTLVDGLFHWGSWTAPSWILVVGTVISCLMLALTAAFRPQLEKPLSARASRVGIGVVCFAVVVLVALLARYPQ